MTDIFGVPSIEKVLLLSPLLRIFTVEQLLVGGSKYNEFLAIPALNSPRAGFARCKENNHV
ncbi:hypothetical protein [Rhodoferax sp. BLA1]|uniref:hypothetical protein n=1 Tax=Rhodoferax sp. BLA1 TaxID=2576062 RepID=UPI0015D196EF|nr:hypothetical protein [Rhodoferax sp. BLA1]